MKNIEIAVNAALSAGEEIMKIYESNNFDVEIKSDKSPVTSADYAANKKILEYLLKTEIPVLSEESEISDYETRKNITNFWLVDPLDGTKEFINRNGEFTVNIALMENNKPVAGVVYAPVLQQLFFSHLDIGAFKIENIAFENKNIAFSELMTKAEKLPYSQNRNNIVVLSSKSHKSEKNDLFIKDLQKKHPLVETISKGSSLKICIIAEGKADIYPRFGPTSEWDTAAGHAILKAAGGNIIDTINRSEIMYNKENILNPDFFAVGSNPTLIFLNKYTLKLNR